jgi:hypothetical protein
MAQGGVLEQVVRKTVLPDRGLQFNNKTGRMLLLGRRGINTPESFLIPDGITE